jgi:hypothetical protein
LTGLLLASTTPACAQVLGVEEITVNESNDGGTIEAPARGCRTPADCAVGVDTPSQCAERTCVDGACEYRTRDGDGDGFRSSAACTIDLPGVTVTPGDDCDDADPTLNPTLKRACVTTPSPFPEGRALGECRTAEQACINGVATPCAGFVGPSPETCDGAKDESCDGAVDEGCPCTGTATRPCGVAVGSCTQGTQSCTGGKWSGCSGGTGPKPRDCGSAVDNDCDGQIDSAQCGCVVGTQQACVTSMPGACSAGKRTCMAGADTTTAAYGPCVPTVSPGALACDGGDHDCNGVVDTAQDAPVAAADNGNACLHLYFCPAADRREVCYVNGVGYTYYCDAGRRTLGYAKKASSAGTPNPAPPAGYVRIAVNSVGTKVGPFGVASACCGAGGCSNPNDANGGVFLSTGELGTQLYTRWP